MAENALSLSTYCYTKDFIGFFIFRCEDNHYWVEVSETTLVGEVIGQVRAKGVPSLLYQLEDQGYFSVNPSTGDVLLRRQLDYESVRCHRLAITVTSMVSVTLCARKSRL